MTTKDYIPIDWSAPDPERDHLEKMWAMLKKRGPDEADIAVQAAMRAVTARKQGLPYNKSVDGLVPAESKPTFTISDVFPEFEKEFEDSLEEVRKYAFTDEKKAQTLTFNAAKRDHYIGLPVKLFGVAMQKIAQTMHAVKKSRNYIAELEGRLAALEKSVVVAAHHGTFAAGKSYSEGTLITHGGALWLATRYTNEDERPGRSDAWRLVVKSGHVNKVFGNE